MTTTRAIKLIILAQLNCRAPTASICPSEVARALWPDDWHAHMGEVRAVAEAMRERGELRITQGDTAIADATRAAGPIRLRLP